MHGIVALQMKAAKDNLRGVLSTPRKATMLFGGNLASQVIFALVLDASLHAYGYSLPLAELIIINSLASVLGGFAPVPGGMGVVEAGLIGGLTAAGIPQNVAVATTFAVAGALPPIGHVCAPTPPTFMESRTVRCHQSRCRARKRRCADETSSRR